MGGAQSGGCRHSQLREDGHADIRRLSGAYCFRKGGNHRRDPLGGGDPASLTTIRLLAGNLPPMFMASCRYRPWRCRFMSGLIAVEVARKLGGAAVLGSEVRSQADLATAVRKRLPLSALKGLTLAGLSE